MKRRVFLKKSISFSGLAAVGVSLTSETSCACMTATSKIKIGQIGTGHPHAYKMGTLRRLTDLFEVVGVADDDPEQRKKNKNKGVYKDLPWLSTEELLAIPGLQAVTVETEEHHTLPVALRCVQAGKHVHIDKPAGESLAEFKQVLDIAKAKNLTVQVGYMFRNNPAIQFCFKAVKDGLLGRIYDVDSAMNRPDEPSYRNFIKTHRGGTPFIFACHMIDLTVTMMGAPEKIHPFLRKTRTDDVIDNSLTVFEYPNGGIATIRTSINEAEGFQHRYLTVRGTKGMITIRPLETIDDMSGGTLYLTLAEASGKFIKGDQIVEMPPFKGRYEDQLIEFANVVNGKIQNPYPYEHEYLVQKCLLKACEMEP